MWHPNNFNENKKIEEEVFKVREVKVCSYSTEWSSLFEREAEKIAQIYGSELLGIYHIGSTSVEGLTAKPIIDIMPIVQNVNHVDMFNEEMINLGYNPKGENGIKGRRYFQKGGDQRTHHVHIYQQGSFEIHRHIAFRDYLRNHPMEKKAYSKLKKKLAAIYPYDIYSYINGKEQMVKDIEQKALQWADLTNEIPIRKD